MFWAIYSCILAILGHFGIILLLQRVILGHFRAFLDHLGPFSSCFRSFWGCFELFRDALGPLEFFRVI
jgi:hypothetical protein